MCVYKLGSDSGLSPIVFVFLCVISAFYLLTTLFIADDHEDKVYLVKDQSHRSIQLYRMQYKLS